MNALIISPSQLSEIPPLDLAALYIILENNRNMAGTTIVKNNPFMMYEVKSAMIANCGVEETDRYLEQARRFLQGE